YIELGTDEDIKAEESGEGLIIEPTSVIEINFWKTKLHDAVLGIRQLEQYRSRSRKFTKGMEVRGQVSFKSKKKKEGKQGKLVVGFNTDFWDDLDSAYLKRHPKNTELYKRISIRLFTELKEDKGGYFMGSIDQSLTETIANSLAQDRPLPVFIIDIPRYDYLIRLVRGRTLVGHRYVFPLIPDKNWRYGNEKRVRFFSIESKKVSVGLDFVVKELGGQYAGKSVAEIDEKKMDVGGKWVLKIKDSSLEENHVFKHILILFCCLCKYLDEVNENTEKLFKLLENQDEFLDTISEELAYFKNPRFKR
ncbi:MAG: hypothetical protein ACTSRA_23160, partial [Promethearchaeota archaeon]